MAEKIKEATVFNQEDIDRKVILAAGDMAPEFELENSDGVSISLRDFRGKNVVLYFYPKDNTPGCTTEACEFSANYDEFIANDTVIVGVSPDSVKSHSGFIIKQNLKHILLSDINKDVAKAYGVWQVRKNYGKEYLGIVRTTFVIDKEGKIAKVYKSVKAAGHAAKVLADLIK
ncbi:MAG: thioredoxin-dependent thiol peroxidase [Campylobacter sp.]|mgnify:FL=1|nr:thioredoxin-dependent thiol peroxidase [Campylobacter sp.]